MILFLFLTTGGGGLSLFYIPVSDLESYVTACQIMRSGAFYDCYYKNC